MVPISMAYYKWFQPGAVDPQRGEAWSTDGWAKMKSWGGQRSWAFLPEKLLGAGDLLPELWQVELEGEEPEDHAVPAKKGRLVVRVEAWNDETAAALAKEWIFAARDNYAEALRIGERHADAPAGLGDEVAAAGTRKDIEAAAEKAAAELRRIYDALDYEAESPTSIALVIEVSRLWEATRAVINEPPVVAATAALLARQDSAVTLERARDQFERGQGYQAAFQAWKANHQVEYDRLGAEFAGRLGLAA